MLLKTPLVSITGIGEGYAARLSRLGIETVEDLLNHYPFRYDDFSNVKNALESNVGETVTLIGEIWSIKNVYTKNRKIITQAIFNDGTSPIELVWFNQSWLIKNLKAGDKIQVSGKVNKFKNKISLVAPVWERVSGVTITSNNLHTGGIVAIYPETANLTSKWLRSKIKMLLDGLNEKIEDPLPEVALGGMDKLETALNKIHFPKTFKEAEEAKERLAFDELFYVQLSTLLARKRWKDKKPVKVFEEFTDQFKEFLDKLPFELTDSQLKVVGEIIEDLKRGQAMNRLVQGEVGSGKTVVAACIAYLTYLNGLKSLIMAPTEILAFQHFKTMENLLSPFGIKVGIYTGSKKFTKGKSQEELEEYSILVGTHALLSEKLATTNIGLVVVDEQQRFGVEQRSILRKKAVLPHFLTMTATPIPRTVALSLYGDLDISVIDKLPSGRLKIKTHVVPAKKRADAYKFIEKLIREKGDQAYIITPLIELSETLTSAKAAKDEYEKLQRDIFPDLKLGLLHGRLSSKEKEEVINRFKDREIDILVSTSVVEVGVDVPNATIMLIENAERFGLAQIHQLRGRVGRGEKQSYCLLFGGTNEPQVMSRLRNLEKIDNGLKLAELDLKIRGSGEIFGVRQSGRIEFKLASFGDLTLIEKTREAAKKVLDESPDLTKFPSLIEKIQSNFGKEIAPD
jgi:ATP-dependent DNA helicase RecG